MLIATRGGVVRGCSWMLVEIEDYPTRTRLLNHTTPGIAQDPREGGYDVLLETYKRKRKK